MLKTNELYFAHPSMWEDPYEQGLLHEHSKNIFAQCWCRKAVSDAMWRIYSPHGLGVRIGTTRERLQAALVAAKATQGIQFKIQNVQYLYQEELNFKLDQIAKTLISKHTVSAAMSPLFLKRNAFSHEQETRVVVHDHATKGDIHRKGFILKVDTHALLRSIWIDPRSPQEHVDAFTLYLKRQLKYQGTVKKSSLYAARDPRGI